MLTRTVLKEAMSERIKELGKLANTMYGHSLSNERMSTFNDQSINIG